jgi:hypothetical protein
MGATLAFVLAAMTAVAPDRDHTELGGAIARVVDASTPLFKEDGDRRKTAALVVAVAFREGSLRANVVGDFVNGAPTSWCTAQINLSPGQKTLEGWTGPELRDDPEKCITVSLRMLRQSVRIDPENPIAFYARGPGWKSDAARRISRDRMALARRLLKAAAS